MQVNPQIAQLRQILAAAEAQGQLEDLVGPDMLAKLSSSSDGTRLFQGVRFEELPVAMPMPWLPIDANIGLSLNDRVVTFTNATANTQTSQVISFDLPCAVFQLNAAVRSTNANLPATVDDPLDLIRVQFKTTGGYQFQTSDVLGSTILGSAKRPGNLGRSGWRFEPGASLTVFFTPLVADLQVDIVIRTIVSPGPGNIAAPRSR